MNKIFLNLLLTILLLAFWSCSNDDPPVMVGVTPSIDEIKTAEKWNPRLAQKYKVEVSVLDPQGPENIAGVHLNVLRDSGGPVIKTDSLYDDGAYYNIEDGDVLAKDGIYSNQFLPSDIIDPVQSGTYLFRFTAKDREGNHSQVSEIVVSFGGNYAPTIVNILAPDSLSVNLVPRLMQVTVSDSDGIDDIERVYFESQKEGTSQIRYESELYNDGDPNHGDMVAGDNIYSLKLDTAFLVAKKGLYDLLFHAEDSFDEKNLIIPVHEISLHNNTPKITEIKISDSLALPNEGEEKFEAIKVTVEDLESLADIDSVYFYSVKEDSTLANNGRPIILRDNGIPINPDDRTGLAVGDSVAGDGIFTFTLVIRSNSIPIEKDDITFTFKFFARDKADNLVGPIVRKLKIFKME